ncbi:MAG TPA: phosphatase PAP2 family protein [Polyangiales bacterium]|nr:phosphatase PAP2 family protein [Polyangiales bacterium]
MGSTFRKLATACGLAFVLAAGGSARADDEVIHPWRYLDEGLIGSFTWPAVLWHISAVAVTPPLVYTLDEPVQRALQHPSDVRDALAHATLIVGAITPVAVPLTLYLGGLAADDSELATAGAAALQAAAVEVLVVSTLKWLTDRAGPYPDGDPTRSRALGFRDSTEANDFNFNPFDLSGGLRWPSGHTASNVAVVSALFAFYPDELWIAAIGYPLALAIGFEMIDGDYHWLSDVVAGALIGHVIGWTIGRNFRRHYDARRRGTPVPAQGVELDFGAGGVFGVRGWF